MPDNVDWKLAGWVAAAVVVVAIGLRSLGDRDAAPAAVRVDAAPAGEARRSSGPRVYVHVAGEVRRPGLYRIPSGSRTAAALDRAGGPTRRADLGAVNLAAKITDGQQVVVPRAGAVARAPAVAGGGTVPGAPAPPVSLATATVEQLDAVDGIGPTLAARIVAERTRRGGFRSVEDLRNVDGIGEKRLAGLKSALAP